MISRIHLRIACALAATIGAGACSFNNYGVVAARVTDADGARVLEVHRIGLGIRTLRADPGLSLGYASQRYVYAREDLPAASPGWHMFVLPWSSIQPVIMHLFTVGGELRFPGFETSVSAGVIASTIMAKVNHREDKYFTATYRPEAPELTRLRICKEKHPCSNQ